MQCVAVCYGVMQCDAVCCSVMQCDAVCCSVLQCVAACYSLPHIRHFVIEWSPNRVCKCHDLEECDYYVLQRVAACCSDIAVTFCDGVFLKTKQQMSQVSRHGVLCQVPAHAVPPRVHMRGVRQLPSRPQMPLLRLQNHVE